MKLNLTEMSSFFFFQTGNKLAEFWHINKRKSHKEKE